MYSKSGFLTLILLFTAISLCIGQSAKGPWSKYEKGDFPAADEGFLKVLCEHPDDVVANMGMGLLCSNSNILLIPELHDRYDLFEAFRYIIKSKTAVDKLTGTELDELNKMIKTIPDVKARVLKEYDNIERMLSDHVRIRQNLDSAILFVNEFPHSKYFHQVLQVRNNVFFEKVKKSEDVSALNDFIERCPDADSIPAAIALRNLAAYNRLMNEERTLDAVYDYLNRYPNSRQYHLVIGLRDNLEFEEAQKVGTFDAYYFFFENFPKSSQAPLLREKYMERLYSEAREKNTVAAYTEFLYRFPMAKPYAQSARNDRDSLCYRMYSGTVDSLNKFISWFPASKFFDNAVRRRDKLAFENAKKENEIEAWEQFIYRYPAAADIREALSSRDSLVLEQVRYLSSEKDFSDFLSDYPYLINLPRTIQFLEEVLYREAKKLDDPVYYQDFLNRCPKSTHVNEIKELLAKKEKTIVKPEEPK